MVRFASMALFAVAMTFAALPARAADFFVLNTSPTGQSSLTAAFALANQTPGPDRIRFNIAGPGPHVIAPEWLLVAEDTVEIDGYSQPGSASNTAEYGSNATIRIVISGQNLPFGPYFDQGLITLRGYGSVLRGVALVNSPASSALRLEGGEHLIHGNFFGLMADGTTPGASQQALVAIGDFNLIGSPELADRNVFVGGNSAILLTGNGAYRNVIRNNLFGTTADGLTRRPFRDNAIQVLAGASSNRIGDFGLATGNVILGTGTGATEGVRIGGHSTASGERESIGNAVLGNTLLGYRGAAIVLARNPGVCSPDDALDQDTGPNRCMNVPSVDSAFLVDGRLHVRGRMRSEPTTRPEFPEIYHVYLNGNGAACNGTLGEAEYPLAADYEVVADAQGNATFEFDVPAGDTPPRSISVQLGMEELFVDSTSPLSPCVPVATPPGAPTLSQAVPGDGQATLHFSASADTGGLPLLDYRIECTPATIAATVVESPAIVGGLQNGIEHSCKVRARNAAGSGAWSASRSFTPRANLPPLIDAPTTIDAMVSSYIHVLIGLQGYPAPILTLDGTLPDGVYFDASSRQLWGTPHRGTIGSHAVVLRAENGIGSPVTHALTIVVGKGRAEIDFDPIANRRLDAGPFLSELWSESPATFTVRSTTPAVCSAIRVDLDDIPSLDADAGKLARQPRGSSGAYAGAVITPLAAGRCEVVVTQPETVDFHASEPVSQAFTVLGPVLFADDFE